MNRELLRDCANNRERLELTVGMVEDVCYALDSVWVQYETTDPRHLMATAAMESCRALISVLRALQKVM